MGLNSHRKHGLKGSPRLSSNKGRNKFILITHYFTNMKGGKSTILIIYIDDIILIGDNVSEMNSLKKRLANEFEIKDLGILLYFMVWKLLEINLEFLCHKENVS